MRPRLEHHHACLGNCCPKVGRSLPQATDISTADYAPPRRTRNKPRRIRVRHTLGRACIPPRSNSSYPLSTREERLFSLFCSSWRCNTTPLESTSFLELVCSSRVTCRAECLVLKSHATVEGVVLSPLFLTDEAPRLSSYPRSLQPTPLFSFYN